MTSRSHSRKIAVVIVTYNSSEEIEASIRSIPRNADTEVIVVDNASTDSSARIVDGLKTLGLVSQLIRSPENLGFSKAVNLAIRECPGRDILLFNPDARMDPGCLERLAELARAEGQVGILSPIVYSKTAVRTMTAGRQPRIWPMFTHFSGISGLFPNVPAVEGRQLFLAHHSAHDRLVEWVAGCCMYIKRETIDAIGVLDERWFMYGEDVQYCKRANDAGFTIRLVHDARCFHEMGASVMKASNDINTMWPRNLYDYYKQEYRPNPVSRTVWRTIFSAGMLGRAGVLWVTARKTGDVPRLAQAVRFRAFATSIWTSSE